MMNRLRFFVCCVFVSVFFALYVYGRDTYQEHRVDYYSVFGIDSGAGGRLEELFRELNEVIDQKGGNSEFIRKLKQEYGLPFGGGRKHRYMFHWGFNVDLSRHTALIEELKGAIEKNVREELEDKQGEYYKELQEQGGGGDLERFVEEKVEEKLEEALEFINKERARQNRALMSKCEEATGLRDRDMVGGLMTVLWNIHVISDYLGTETGGLLPFHNVSIDLKRGLERLFDKDRRQSPEVDRKLREVLKELDRIYGSSFSDRDRACGYLNYLCGYSDCGTQQRVGQGAIASLFKSSTIVKGILNKSGINI